MRKFSEDFFAEDLPWEKLRGKTIFCTGCTGVLGRGFARALCELERGKSLGMRIFLFRRKGREHASDSELSALGARWIEGDIRDPLPAEIQADIIFHAASPANKRSIQSDPRGLVETNILATKRLLERARECGSTFVFISSGEVYARSPEAVSEEKFSALEKRVRGLSDYAECKAMGELLCETSHENYGVEFRIVRPFSIYGEEETADTGRCLPDLVSQAADGREIFVSGTGAQVRGYCHADDFTAALFYIILNGGNSVYNVGNEENVCSIYELAQLAARLGGVGVNAPNHAADARGKDVYLPDTGRLRALGWRPKIGLEECVGRIFRAAVRRRGE